MKKLHFTILVGIFSAMIITNNVEAQSHELATRKSVSENTISKTFSRPVSENVHSVPAEKINARALKDLKKQYETSDEKWVKSKDGFTASLKVDHTGYAVYYDKKGHWVATIKSYAEDLLKKDIRTMVKREYFDFNIKGINEIEYSTYNSSPTYIVIIQHENSVKWIRINNGMMSVYKEL